MKKVFIAFLILVLPIPAYAGAVAVARQRRAQAGQQAQMEAYRQAQEQAQGQAYQQAQVQAYQQAAAEHQAQEIQAYQQQLMMQQALQQQINQEIQAYVQAQQIQAAQADMVKQAVMQQLAQQMMQNQAHQIEAQMINQTVARVVGEAQAQRVSQETQVVNRVRLDQIDQAQTAVIAQELQAHQQAAMTNAMLQGAEAQKMSVMNNQRALGNAANQRQYETAVAKQLGQQALAGLTKPFEQVDSSEVKDVVDIAEVWKNLDSSSQAWTLMIDNQAKAMTVSEYIDRYRKEGAKINQDPSYYVQAIDAMFAQNPQMLQRPFKELLQFVAIVDYDFDAGADRDQLAKKLLGEGAAYQANKKRLGR